MKKEVSREEYFDFFKNNSNLKPISSFSDPDGTSPYGIGRPSMDTDWGVSGTDDVLATHEMRKEHRNNEWETRYFLTVTERHKKLVLSNMWQNMDDVILCLSSLHYQEEGAGLRQLLGLLKKQHTETVHLLGAIDKKRVCRNIVMEVCALFWKCPEFRAGFDGYTHDFREAIATSLKSLNDAGNRAATFSFVKDKLVGQSWNGIDFETSDYGGLHRERLDESIRNGHQQNANGGADWKGMGFMS
jgi:hypothetical protein